MEGDDHGKGKNYLRSDIIYHGRFNNKHGRYEKDQDIQYNIHIQSGDRNVGKDGSNQGMPRKDNSRETNDLDRNKYDQGREITIHDMDKKYLGRNERYEGWDRNDPRKVRNSPATDRSYQYSGRNDQLRYSVQSRLQNYQITEDYDGGVKDCIENGDNENSTFKYGLINDGGRLEVNKCSIDCQETKGNDWRDRYNDQVRNVTYGDSRQILESRLDKLRRLCKRASYKNEDVTIVKLQQLKLDDDKGDDINQKGLLIAGLRQNDLKDENYNRNDEEIIKLRRPGISEADSYKLKDNDWRNDDFPRQPILKNVLKIKSDYSNQDLIKPRFNHNDNHKNDRHEVAMTSKLRQPSLSRSNAASNATYQARSHQPVFQERCVNLTGTQRMKDKLDSTKFTATFETNIDNNNVIFVGGLSKLEQEISVQDMNRLVAKVKEMHINDKENHLLPKNDARDGTWLDRFNSTQCRDVLKDNCKQRQSETQLRSKMLNKLLLLHRSGE